jgi:hypothetical protein
MYELELTKSLGRTGNCLICIINAIEFAINNKINKIKFHTMLWWTTQLLPGGQNELINKLEIDIDSVDLCGTICENTENEKKSILKNRGSLIWNKEKIQFESWFCGFYSHVCSFNKRIYIVQKYIKPILNIETQILDENDLVIHLRSGDIMSKGHSSYIQPPLCFYEEIINLKKWNKIYIITENKNNPCLDILKNKYVNIITFLDNKKNRHGGNGFGFNHDLGYLIGAYNFIPSSTSLSPLIIQLSKTIKNVYIPSYMLQSKGKNIPREYPIWWSNDLKDKKTNITINNIEFHVFDYDQYTNIDKPIHKYNEEIFRKYLTEYNN